MADSVQKDQQGPDWPLGIIVNAVPGTPIPIMSLVDSASVNSPGTTIPLAGALPTGAFGFTPRAKKIIFFPCKKDVNGTKDNTGNIYIVRQGVQGAGNRNDYGSIVMVLRKTDPPFILNTQEDGSESLSPYRYSIDADNAADGCLVTLLV